MSLRIKAEFKGLAPLIQKLGGMRKALRNKHLRAAMRKSVSIVNKATKPRAPVGATKQLRRSYGVKVKVYPSGVVFGVVEPRPGFKVPIPRFRGSFVAVRYHDPRRIAHLVERGTQARRTKAGAFRGAARAQPHLGISLTTSEAQIMGIFGTEIDKALEEVTR